ncbi:MAG TPA: hypothetical protein P5556_02065 [Candidatus Gastranaerophilales bacterium]|nr:hypothetical protein [Candidatus Gastranaerophilales bacterium]
MQLSLNSYNKQPYFAASPARYLNPARFMLAPGYEKDFSLVNVDVKKLDKLLSADRHYYVGKNAVGGVKTKYDRAKEYIFETSEPIYASLVAVSKTSRGIEAGIMDGRHRFAAIRDAGIDKVPVSIKKDQLPLAKTLNLLT